MNKYYITHINPTEVVNGDSVKLPYPSNRLFSDRCQSQCGWISEVGLYIFCAFDILCILCIWYFVHFVHLKNEIKLNWIELNRIALHNSNSWMQYCSIHCGIELSHIPIFLYFAHIPDFIPITKFIDFPHSSWSVIHPLFCTKIQHASHYENLSFGRNPHSWSS